MKLPKFLALLTVALMTAGAGCATAAVLQFSLTNIAPADSISFEPALLQSIAPDISNVMVTSAPGGMGSALPQLTFHFGVDAASAVFPPVGGGVTLPVLFPGDTITFTLEIASLVGQGALNYGASLFTQTPIATPGGQFIGADLTLTAGAIAMFDSGSGSPLLVLPGSISPGPASISPSTAVLRLSVVPEPSAALFGLPAFALALRRRRK